MSQPDIWGVRSQVTAQLHRLSQPVAGEASALARTTDPTQQPSPAGAPPKMIAGVAWTPALDVLVGHGHQLASWHANLQERVIKQVHASAGRAASRPWRAIKPWLMPVVTSNRPGLPPDPFGRPVPVTSGQVIGS